LECLPAAYGNPRSFRTRLIEASKPVIQRMTIDYRNLLHDAYFRSFDWPTREFFGRGVIPKLPMPNRVAAMPTGGGRERTAIASVFVE